MTLYGSLACEFIVCMIMYHIIIVNLSITQNTLLRQGLVYDHAVIYSHARNKLYMPTT